MKYIDRPATIFCFCDASWYKKNHCWHRLVLFTSLSVLPTHKVIMCLFSVKNIMCLFSVKKRMFCMCFHTPMLSYLLPGSVLLMKLQVNWKLKKTPLWFPFLILVLWSPQSGRYIGSWLLYIYRQKRNPIPGSYPPPWELKLRSHLLYFGT